MALTDVDNDGNVWAGFQMKSMLLPSGENRLEAFPVSDKLRFETKTMVMKFLLKENEVWMGTDRGLYRYYRNEDALKVYRSQEDNPRSLSHDYVSELVVTDSKQLIAGTLKGINIYNPSSDDFDPITQENSSEGLGLNSNFINSMLFDDGSFG